VRVESPPFSFVGLALAGVICVLASPAAARETRPYFDLAFGLGLAGERIDLADGSKRRPGGTVYLVEGRFLFPVNQGFGLRLSYFDELDIFDSTSSSSTLLASAGYVVRGEPRRGFHAVPALFLGPSLSAHSAPSRDPSDAPTTPGCALGLLACEPAPLEATDHAALGLTAAFSLDLHGETLFGGLDIAGNYGFPLADRDVQRSEWAVAVSLRFGATIKARSLGRR
jgi:hypothetical protein